jgi:hypothetical protein
MEETIQFLSRVCQEPLPGGGHPKSCGILTCDEKVRAESDHCKRNCGLDGPGHEEVYMGLNDLNQEKSQMTSTWSFECKRTTGQVSALSTVIVEVKRHTSQGVCSHHHVRSSHGASPRVLRSKRGWEEMKERGQCKVGFIPTLGFDPFLPTSRFGHAGECGTWLVKTRPESP